MAGSKKQIRPGVWRIRVSTGRNVLTGEYGRENRTVYGTARDADRALRELQAEVELGMHRHRDKTVRMLLEAWLEVAQRNLSPTTVRSYRDYLDNRILPAIGDRKVHQLRTEDLDRFYAALQDAGLKPRSIQQCHSIIRRGFRQGEIWEWLPKGTSPTKYATLPRVPEAEISPPSRAEVVRLIRAVDDADPVLAGFLFLAARTGARRGELCALRWTDVGEGTLTIARAIVNVEAVDGGRQQGAGHRYAGAGEVATLEGSGLHEKDTKSHQRRVVTLDAQTIEMLRRHRRYVVGQAELAGVTLALDAFLFSRCPAGCHPIDPNDMTAAFRGVRKKVGVQCRLHDLRHFMATEMLDLHVPLPVVSKRLGHRLVSTTANIYAHATAEGDWKAAELLGDALDDAERKELEPGSGRDNAHDRSRG
jgi:integrase